MARVVGFHFIVTAYGFWLPNDPRGSWSSVIRQWNLLHAGPATKVETDRSLAGDPHDAAKRKAAKRLLKYPPVRLNGVQARAVARGIRNAAEDAGYKVHAFSVMPDHFHLVMAWHEKHIDHIAGHLKACVTMVLNREGVRPMARHARRERSPSPWARNHWCPFIWDDEQMRAAIAYVEKNPVKAGLPRQTWRFVTPWEGPP